MAFNEANVKIFFDKLAVVMERYECFKDGSRVYNLDETNTSTVQNTRRILSPKGVKQVHQVKGAERGESVTTCVIIGAYGTVLPPVHIFPRKKFNADFLINAYPGAVGLANAKGYMTKETFVQVMQHFIKCTGSSQENPTLLLLDNVDTHFSTESLDLAKSHGVTVFTFPPHCTHKLQPLDVGFFGPFKTYYDQAINNFLSNNPACPPTIYRVAGFVKDALSKAASPQTIIKAFEAPGIVPYNRNIFTEADFLMASVTARAKPNENDNKPDGDTGDKPDGDNGDLTDENDAQDAVEAIAIPSQSNVAETLRSANTDADDGSFVGAMDIRGLPKAKPSTTVRKPRRKGKCMIATDTPEKEEVKQREESQRQKREQIEERKRKREMNKKVNAPAKKKCTKSKGRPKPAPKRVNRKLIMDLESDSSEEADDVEEVSLRISPHSFPALKKGPEEGDFALVSFQTGKENEVFYVGKILSEKDDEDDMEISYYRKHVNHDQTISFYLPNIPDLNSVNISDVKFVLPKPKSCDQENVKGKAGTKRQQGLVTFDFDFSLIKLG